MLGHLEEDVARTPRKGGRRRKEREHDEMPLRGVSTRDCTGLGSLSQRRSKEPASALPFSAGSRGRSSGFVESWRRSRLVSQDGRMRGVRGCRILHASHGGCVWAEGKRPDAWESNTLVVVSKKINEKCLQEKYILGFKCTFYPLLVRLNIFS